MPYFFQEEGPHLQSFLLLNGLLLEFRRKYLEYEAVFSEEQIKCELQVKFTQDRRTSQTSVDLATQGAY